MLSHWSREAYMTISVSRSAKPWRNEVRYALSILQRSPIHGWRSQEFPGIYTCSLNDGLDTIFDTIRKSRVHRLVVVDGDFRLKGVLTLSDILQYILLEGENDESSWYERDLLRTSGPGISKICMETALTHFYFGSILRLATSGLAGNKGLRRIFIVPLSGFFLPFIAFVLVLSSYEDATV